MQHVDEVNTMAVAHDKGELDDKLPAEWKPASGKPTPVTYDVRTSDVKDYFTRTNMAIALKTWSRIVERIKQVRPGQTYVSIKRTGILFRPHAQTGGDSFRKTMITNAKQNEVTITHRRPDGRFYFFVNLDMMTEVLSHAIRFAYSRANGRVFRQVEGGPMGVAVTEFMCLLQTTMIESVSRVGRSPADLILRRMDTYNKYVDDSLLQLPRTNEHKDRPWMREDYYYDGASALRNIISPVVDPSAEIEYLGCMISTVNVEGHSTSINCMPRMPRLTAVQSAGTHRDKAAIMQSILHASKLRTAAKTWAEQRINIMGRTVYAAATKGYAEPMAREALWRVSPRLSYVSPSTTSRRYWNLDVRAGRDKLLRIYDIRVL